MRDAWCVMISSVEAGHLLNRHLAARELTKQAARGVADTEVMPAGALLAAK